MKVVPEDFFQTKNLFCKSTVLHFEELLKKNIKNRTRNFPKRYKKRGYFIQRCKSIFIQRDTLLFKSFSPDELKNNYNPISFKNSIKIEFNIKYNKWIFVENELGK